MNEGLSTAGLGRTDRWLTGEDVGFTAEELAALRPAAWYAWERNEDGRTVLSARVYEDTEIPTPDFFDSGDGTEEDPWIIRTLAQLQAFRAFFAKSDFDGAYIALAADLDLTGTEWAPIGHTDRGVQAFRGHFDGRGPYHFRHEHRHGGCAGFRHDQNILWPVCSPDERRFR